MVSNDNNQSTSSSSTPGTTTLSSPLQSPSLNRKNKSITRCVSMCNSDPHCDESSSTSHSHSHGHGHGHHHSPCPSPGGNSISTPKRKCRKRPRTPNGKGILSPSSSSSSPSSSTSSKKKQVLRDEDVNLNVKVKYHRSAMDMNVDMGMNMNMDDGDVDDDSTIAKSNTSTLEQNQVKKSKAKCKPLALGPASAAARNIHLNTTCTTRTSCTNLDLSPYTRIPASPVRSVVSCDGDSDHEDGNGNGNSNIHSSTSQPQPVAVPPNMNEVTKRVSMGHGHENEQVGCDCEDKGTNNCHDPLQQNLQLHLRALWIEANLAPMKPLLYRLITHQSYNRKGTFNYPVDADALGLKDYNVIVKRPMDLGTIKTKLLSNLYASGSGSYSDVVVGGEYSYDGREDVANDIRLVFQNACLYNPPTHPVHEAARHLLAYFEDHYATILRKSGHQSQSHAQVQAPLGVASSSSASASAPPLLPTLHHQSGTSMSITPALHHPAHAHTQTPTPAHTHTQTHAASYSSVHTHNRKHPNGQLNETHLSWNQLVVQKSHQTSYAYKQQAHLLPPIKHTCQSCQGHTCNICHEGCLSMEPSLLICAGSACAGTKIRRGIHYYCTADGTKTWCQKCYSSLPAILPSDDGESPLSGVGAGQMFKRDLLKRKNDEDVVERWICCSKCKSFSHEICAFVNEFFTDRENFICPLCTKSALPLEMYKKRTRSDDTASSGDEDETASNLRVHSFVTGKDQPELVADVIAGTPFDSRSLMGCEISDFIEKKVKERMIELDCPKDTEHTLTVRVISDYEKDFNVPDVVLKHFRSQEVLDDENLENMSSSGVKGVQYFAKPASCISYRSKAISLFQRIDGMDVCIFTMYVQEYDGENHQSSTQRKRIYIAYIDSVEHFQPRRLRTHIYHEILVAYLATARARGYEYAHIWSCPPTRGNSFVFWGHPSTQRTPSKELLLKWYHNALSLAANKGIVTDVKSLYEHSFKKFDKKQDKTKEDFELPSVIVAPPLLDGDFWIEEAARTYSASVSRSVRAKKVVAIVDEIPFSPDDVFRDHSKCPVMQVSTLIKEYFMRHPLSTPFHQPVNAVALKLRDYHDIIKKPMDLGTVLSQCLLGDYDTFEEVYSDLDLIFKNAMRYNPKKHVIHNMADELWKYVEDKLSDLAKYWHNIGVRTPLSLKSGGSITYNSFGDLRMHLSSIITASGCDSISMEPSLIPSHDKHQIIPACSMDENSTQDQLGPMNDSNLLFQGAEGITKLMVGEDVFLLDKRHAQKEALKKKKKGGKKKKSNDQPAADYEKRRESWLGDEVLAAVRRLRTDIFVCRLSPKSQIQMSNIEREKEQEFSAYVKDFEVSCTSLPTSPGIICKPSTNPGVADTRHGLLEFSQYCNLQFDTIRRARYSTAMLLYYLQNPDAPGIIPSCSHCEGDIVEVRWRRINKAFDERRRGTLNLAIRTMSVDMSREEVCGCCYEKMSSERKDHFIPIRVSFLRNSRS